MTKTEKRRFIRDMYRNNLRAMLAKVDAMPAEWDGHELRAFIADDTNEQTAGSSLIRREPRSSRARAYRNARATLPGL